MTSTPPVTISCTMTPLIFALGAWRPALAMISEVQGAKLLQGFRGRPRADIDALADTLVRTSQMAVHLEGRLEELDINPLVVLPSGQGVRALDALVVLRK